MLVGVNAECSRCLETVGFGGLKGYMWFKYDLSIWFISSLNQYTKGI